MDGLDISQLTQFSSALDALVRDAPELQKELHTELADELKQALDNCIDETFPSRSYRIINWQEKHVGSMGGYAAVRPAKGDTEMKWKGKPMSKGLITAKLEDGHSVRRPSGSGKNYRPRLKTVYVDGRHFYANTAKEIERTAISRAERMVNTIAERLEGGG